jgi:hypothetical protein
MPSAARQTAASSQMLEDLEEDEDNEDSENSEDSAGRFQTKRKHEDKKD